MKNLIFSLLFILIFSSCSSEKDEVQNELVEIRKLLEEINVKLSLKETESNLLKPNGSPMHVEKNLDVDALDNILLPENPSKKDILKYLREITKATQSQRSFSASDPQVYMLTEVGHENLKYLLSYKTDHMSDMHFNAAITNLAKEEDKELILRYLPVKKRLIEVVVAKHWQEDAKLILNSELAELPQYLPTEWINAVASFDEPCTYDNLKNFLIYGSNRSWTYKAIINSTSIEDLDDTVTEAWENAKKEHGGWDRSSFAPVAASYGHVDALETIIDSLDSPSDSHTSVYQPRKHIFEFTEIRGTNDEIRKWFKENRMNLIFDKQIEKFKIK